MIKEKIWKNFVQDKCIKIFLDCFEIDPALSSIGFSHFLVRNPKNLRFMMLSSLPPSCEDKHMKLNNAIFSLKICYIVSLHCFFLLQWCYLLSHYTNE